MSTTAIRELTAALPDGAVVVDTTTLDAYSHDCSHHAWERAAAVVHCSSTDEVAAAVQACARNNMPMVARGSGTGLEGAANATAKTVVLDLSRMNRILCVHERDFNVVVEAGVRKHALNAHLQRFGLWMPTGPGINASVGGMLSTRASGTQAVGYGTIRESALGLRVVLANGRVIRTGARVRKSAAGYDLTHLFVGAEGTLGVITEATLRVEPIPETAAVLLCSFADLGHASRSVYEMLLRSLPLTRAEILDSVTVGAINRYAGTSWREEHALILEVSGAAHTVTVCLGTMERLAVEGGATAVATIRAQAEMDAIWAARDDALPASAALVDGASTWSTDVCVPISRLAECLAATKKDVDENGLLAPIAGHIGDGNFHLAFVLPPGDTDVLERARAVNQRLIRRAIQMDGTCSGEHGIGRGKRDALRLQYGEGIDVMRGIKDALDPRRLLNPGAVMALTATTRV